MREWIEGVAGPAYASALMWTLLALIALLVVLVLLKIVRGFTFGTFVAGGRNRRARLAVMDATAVDSHRRLVLVRRDDVEHLLLIGGPTDVVVEHNIGAMGQSASPMLDEEIAPALPLPAHAAPAQPAHQSAPPMADLEHEIEEQWIDEEPYRQEPVEAPRPVHATARDRDVSFETPRPNPPAPDRTSTIASASHPAADQPVRQPMEDFASQSRRPEPDMPAPAYQATPQPRPTPPETPPYQAPTRSEPRVMPDLASAPSARPQPAPSQPEREQAPRPAPVEPAFARPAAASAFAAGTQTPHFASADPGDDGSLDDALMEELVLTLDADQQREEPQPQSDLDASLDDEMARLLSELSSERR